MPRNAETSDRMRAVRKYKGGRPRGTTDLKESFLPMRTLGGQIIGKMGNVHL